MEKYQCRCQYVYDPSMGDMTQGITMGTSFDRLPGDWICPTCGLDKSHFLKNVGEPNSELGHPTINVKARCFGTLAKEEVCGFRADSSHDLYEGSTVHDLADKLEVPIEAVKIIFRNHREADGDTVLRAGDRVAFSPATGGM
jgi:rubredoxin